MKNATPFIASRQVMILENRIKELLGNDAEMYIFSQSLANREMLVQGMSISANNYYKINAIMADMLVADLDCIHVNYHNTNSSEVLFTIATKEDMKIWYDAMYEGKASTAVCEKFYYNHKFNGSDEEIDAFKAEWYSNNLQIVA